MSWDQRFEEKETFRWRLTVSILGRACTAVYSWKGWRTQRSKHGREVEGYHSWSRWKGSHHTRIRLQSVAHSGLCLLHSDAARSQSPEKRRKYLRHVLGAMTIKMCKYLILLRKGWSLNFPGSCSWRDLQNAAHARYTPESRSPLRRSWCQNSPGSCRNPPVRSCTNIRQWKLGSLPYFVK